MGDAKRRKRQGRQLADGLEQRIAAGAFGPAGARCAVVVLDKAAPQAREALDALRAAAGALGLAAAVETEDFRFWEASTLLRYAVLYRGGAAPEGGVLLAADLRRLTVTALPQAAARVAAATARPGLVVEVDHASRAAVTAALERLQLAE